MRRALLFSLCFTAACAKPAPPPPPPIARPIPSHVATAVAPPAVEPPRPPEPPSEPPPPPRICGEDEVLIPATGPEGFTMGRGPKHARDQAHQVILTRAFCMDTTEVTARTYRACFDAHVCTVPKTDQWASFHKERWDHPINMVSWFQAKRFCGWVQKRLPTEAEWEWAATGPTKARWPWGDAPEPSCEIVDYTPSGAPRKRAGGDVGCFGGGPSDVKAHPRGVKHWPDGDLWALAGNVWEWTEDSRGPYPEGPVTDPVNRDPTTANRMIRGGGWNRPAPGLLPTFRAAAHFDYKVPGLGFRCVRTAPGE